MQPVTSKLHYVLAIAALTLATTACAASSADLGTVDGAGNGPNRSGQADAGATSPTVDAAPPSVGESDDIYGQSIPRDDSYWVADARMFHGDQEIRLHGINWFGLETPENALHGLWTGRSLDSFLGQLADLGFSALRVPVARPSIQPGHPSASWANHGTIDTGREHLEELLERAEVYGLRILLDIHTCDPAVGGGFAPGPEGCNGYSRTDWLDDLRALATLARDHGNVVGIDLFNEPHGLTWTDWRVLAELGAETVLRTNPRILVFVEGVGGASPAGGFSPFWGENLALAGTEPVGIPESRRVYSPHVYGPGVAAQDYFDAADFPANMPTVWDAHFGYLASSEVIAIGEFGGHPTGDDLIWQRAFVEYLIAREIGHFFYWSLNPNSGDTGGLLADDWTTVNPDRLAVLQSLGL